MYLPLQGRHLFPARKKKMQLIKTPGLISLDFADVKTVMSGRGLAMMEEALGAPSDEDEEKDEQYDPELDELDDYDNGGDDFYSKMLKKSKATKDERKQRYAVAPKFPRVENDIVGDRTASKQILKNRGLVAHKAKLNRNPRAKHREKFRKATIRRAGAVQAIRSPSEGDRYGGEATGISTNVVRSRKLG